MLFLYTFYIKDKSCKCEVLPEGKISKSMICGADENATTIITCNQNEICVEQIFFNENINASEKGSKCQIG